MSKPDDHSWITQAFVQREQGSLRTIRMNVGSLLCIVLSNYGGRGIEIGDVSTIRELLDIIDRLYALENALSPDWRTNGR